MNNPVLKLIREMNLAIFNENELVDKDIVVLFPGKFNPMGIHQKEEYDRLCRKFGKENVYVITDDKVDIQRLPLSYDEKYAIMKRHGVKNIIKSNTPYHATDVIEKFSSRFKSNISILFLPAVIETLSSSVILFLTSPFKRI